MFGSALKVDFEFSSETKKDVQFPRNSKWLDLNNFQAIVTPTYQGVTYTIQTNFDYDVTIFQAVSTIVPLQDTKAYPVKKVEDLKEVPLLLSVTLDNSE